jgi:hypothetical protein
MSENSNPQESKPLEIGNFIKEVQSLQNQTSQLQQTTNALKNKQKELAGAKQTKERILSQIQSLSGKPQPNANQIRRLKEIDLPNADKNISRNEQEIKDLETKEQKHRVEKRQQLVNTFQSLHGAVNYISNQNDYFNKYVWCDYLNSSVKNLKPDELTSLQDKLTASGIMETFQQEFSNSQNKLTVEDKKDIGVSATLGNQIPNDEKRSDELKRLISKENEKLSAFENELSRLNQLEGYSPAKLHSFKVWGLISLVIGLASLVYGLVSANNIIAIIGTPVIIAAALILWLRYKNDKQSRLADTNQKIENLKAQRAQHNAEVKTLQEQILNSTNQLQDIWKRRPILKTIGISHN